MSSGSTPAFNAHSVALLTALARRLSKNEVEQLLQMVEATTRSGGVISEAVKEAVDRAKAVIEELERKHAA